MSSQVVAMKIKRTVAGTIATALMLVLAWSPGVSTGEEVSAPSGSVVLVLDNCDSDFKTPPFEDAVLALVPGSHLRKKSGGLNIA